MNIERFDTAQELNAHFGERLCRQLAEAIALRGKASLLVSGGSTPRALFAWLSEQDIDWSKVTVGLVDDRWVAPDHESSNEKMVREVLLQYKASTANFIGMKTAQDDAFAAELEVSERVSAIPMPFDIVILGMGEDGHTASIFPCCDQLHDALTTNNIVMATQPTTAPFQRMTFTKSALLNSRQLYLHLVGANKEDVLDNVLQTGTEQTAPITAFLNQDKVPMTVMLALSK